MPKSYIVYYNSQDAPALPNANGSKTDITITPNINGFIKKGRVICKFATLIYSSTGSAVSASRNIGSLNIGTNIGCENFYNGFTTFSDRFLLCKPCVRATLYNTGATQDATTLKYILTCSDLDDSDTAGLEIRDFNLNSPINIKFYGDDASTLISPVDNLGADIIERSSFVLRFIDESDEDIFKNSVKYIKEYIINERQKGKEIIT